MRFRVGSFMPFVTNRDVFSWFFTPVTLVFLKAGTGSEAEAGRCPFSGVLSTFGGKI